MKGDMKDGQIEWDAHSSRDTDYDHNHGIEETEAANMLVSLGNSRSTTPAAFSPAPSSVSSLSPRKRHPSSPQSGAGLRGMNAAFTPISPHPNQPHAYMASPTRSWSSANSNKSGSSSSEHISPITPRCPQASPAANNGSTFQHPAINPRNRAPSLAMINKEAVKSNDSGIDVNTPKVLKTVPSSPVPQGIFLNNNYAQSLQHQLNSQNLALRTGSLSSCLDGQQNELKTRTSTQSLSDWQQGNETITINATLIPVTLVSPNGMKDNVPAQDSVAQHLYQKHGAMAMPIKQPTAATTLLPVMTKNPATKRQEPVQEAGRFSNTGFVNC